MEVFLRRQVHVQFFFFLIIFLTIIIIIIIIIREFISERLGSAVQNF
jgi:hypothetical protein